MESLFLINPQKEIFLEKHWRAGDLKSSRGICDYFLEKLRETEVSISSIRSQEMLC